MTVTDNPAPNPGAARVGEPTTPGLAHAPVTAPLRVIWYVTLLSAVCLPMVSLGVRGGTNASYFLLILTSLVGTLMLARTRADRGLPWHAFRARYGWACVAMALPLLAVLCSQLATGDITGRPYDSPARMAAVGLGVWWLTRCPRALLRHVQWGVCIGAIVGAAALGVFTHAWVGDARPTPAFATAITFGNLALLLGVFAWLSLGWRQTRSALETPVKLLAGVAGLAASFVSQSRGGWLAVPVLVIALLLLWRGHWRIKLATLGSACILLAGVYAGSDMVQERVTQASIELSAYAHGQRDDSSIGLRMQFWQASVDMFQEHPWTGVGPQNIRSEFQARAASGELSDAVSEFTHSHSDVLWAMASLGVPGLLALLAIYFAPLAVFLRAARSRERAVSAAGFMGVCLVLGYMVFGLTEAMFAITMNAAFYAGMTAILLALCRPPYSRLT